MNEKDFIFGRAQGEVFCFVRKIQILVQAQICTWLIVYTEIRYALKNLALISGR